jgi:ABC-type uncharacterized transport system ATPase subunit
MQSLKEHPDWERLGQAIQHFIQWQLQNKQLPITLESASNDDLTQWADRILFANTLEEVFAS